MVKYRRIFDKGIAYYRKNGIRGTLCRIQRKLLLARPVSHEKWLKQQRLSKNECKALKRQCMDLLRQIEVCAGSKDVQQSKKDWVLIVQKGSKLEEDALPQFCRAIRQHSQADLFYCDSDRLTRDGAHLTEPLFKPEFDDVLLEGMSYVDGGFLVKRDLLQTCPTINADTRDGRHWAYELFCSCSKKSRGVVHITKMLYHAPADGEIMYRKIVRLPLPHENPLVSILIPNKDHAEMLKTCVSSILAHTGGVNCEILILENNSQEEETFAYYKELEKSGRVRILYWMDRFNYSAVNNYGAAQAKGDYLLFLNNDTEMKSSGALAQMLALGQRKDVGAVGAKLLYPEGTVQHAGVILGYGGIAGHVFEGLTENEMSKIPWSRAVRQYSAVTAACMLVKKELFAEIGGFDENLRVAYNDIDLCLRIRAAGKKVLYTPDAELIHYESATRGLELTREKAERVSGEAERFCTRWQKELSAGDPFYHPDLTLEKNDYSLRR